MNEKKPGAQPGFFIAATEAAAVKHFT